MRRMGGRRATDSVRGGAAAACEGASAALAARALLELARPQHHVPPLPLLAHHAHLGMEPAALDGAAAQLAQLRHAAVVVVAVA